MLSDETWIVTRKEREEHTERGNDDIQKYRERETKRKNPDEQQTHIYQIQLKYLPVFLSLLRLPHSHVDSWMLFGQLHASPDWSCEGPSNDHQTAIALTRQSHTACAWPQHGCKTFRYLSWVKNAPTCYRAPNGLTRNFHQKYRKNTPPGRNSGTP